MTWLFITQNTVKSIDLVRHDLNLHAGCVEINTIVQFKQMYPFIFLDALNALYSAEKVQKYRQALTDARNQKCRDVARKLWNWTQKFCVQFHTFLEKGCKQSELYKKVILLITDI